VRSRTYDAGGATYLEVKTRAGEQTVKTRLEGAHVTRAGLTADGLAFVGEALTSAGVELPGLVGSLAPVLRTHYLRSTLELGDGAGRVTLDHGLAWRRVGGRAEVTRPALVVVETKSAGAASPADRLLWRLGRRPTRISKYATGLAALDPDLPHNRWSRTLRRHF